MSALTQLAKRFLIHESVEKYPTYEIDSLREQLVVKKQFRLYAKEYKKKQQQLEQAKTRGIKHYSLAYQLANGHLDYLHQIGILTKEDNFSELTHNLDLKYLLNKLKLHVTMLSVGQSTKKAYDYSSIHCISSLLDLPIYAKHPLVIVYRTVIKLMETNEEATYIDLLKLLDQYNEQIPKKDLVDFYYVAGNYWVYQTRKGKSESNQKVFELYKKMDQKDLLLMDKFMQAVKLKNLVIVACRAHEFEWATAMLDKYRSYIKKEFQQSVYHFNLGAIHSYQGQYQEAIKHLIRVEKVNLAYDLDSRLLLLQAYYELDKMYDERTMQIFRSAEHFVQNHKSLPAIHKKSYKHFIQLLISLYRVRHQVGKRTLASVREKLLKTESVMARQWLLDRMEGLK